MHDIEEQINDWADHVADGAAPPVTAPEAIELAGRIHGSTPRRRRGARWLAAAAVVGVVAAGAAALGATRSTGSTDEVVTQASEPPPASTAPIEDVPFDLLGTGRTTREPIGTLRGATDGAQLHQLWSAAGLVEPPPQVDFADTAVVSITIPDDGCPAALDRLERRGEVIEPIFTDPPGPCTRPLIPTTFVVALDTSPGVPVQLHLPSQPTFSTPDTLLTLLRTTLDFREKHSPSSAEACTGENSAGTPVADLPIQGLPGAPSDGELWGAGSLFTVPVGSDFPVQTDVDGSWTVKLGWFRTVPGTLTVSAEPVGFSGVAVAEVPGGYQPTGFQPSGIRFDRAGCWAITGRHSDGDELTMNVWVP